MKSPGMVQAKYGDKAKVHYVGKLTNGRVFDSSIRRTPEVSTKRGWNMSIFKKEIAFGQYLFDLITYQVDFLEKNFDKLIIVADESKILTDRQKEDFLDKAHELLIVDIIMGCNLHFHKDHTSEEIGEDVSIVYAKYLTEYQKLSETLAEKKLEKVIKLLALWCKAGEQAQERDVHYKKMEYISPDRIESGIDKMKLYLCNAFCDYSVGEDEESEDWQGRQFAAFKFAKAFVLSDIVGTYLKKVKVTF